MKGTGVEAGRQTGRRAKTRHDVLGRGESSQTESDKGSLTNPTDSTDTLQPAIVNMRRSDGQAVD